MQIDWWTLALQTVNFLIVVWLLGRFLYRPVRRIIDEREAAGRKAAEAAEAKWQAAEALRKDYEARLAALEASEHERDAALHAKAEAERQALLQAAEDKAATLVAEARDRIERERAETLGTLRDQIAGLAGELAAKALASAPADGEDALARVTQQLDGLTDKELADLRRDLTGPEGLVVAAPRALAEPERKAWAEALSARFGAVPLAFAESPDLLGGVALRFPHAVIDFSVAGRLRRAAESIAD